MFTGSFCPEVQIKYRIVILRRIVKVKGLDVTAVICEYYWSSEILSSQPNRNKFENEYQFVVGIEWKLKIDHTFRTSAKFLIHVDPLISTFV